MATKRMSQLTIKDAHGVGTLSSWKARDIANGALVGATPVDNYTLVELYFDINGERACRQLAAVGTKAYLIASPEVRYLNEPIEEFFNGAGDRGRIVILESGLRFETSSFTLNTGVTEAIKGLVAHFDPSTKKFILSATTALNAGYAGSSAKFTVVSDTDDTAGNFIQDTVRLEVQ